MRKGGTRLCASLALSLMPAALAAADGPYVNVSARLQDLTRMSQYRTDILVSAATLAAARGRYAVRPLGAAPVRGRDEPVEIFAIDGAEPPGMP